MEYAVTIREACSDTVEDGLREATTTEVRTVLRRVYAQGNRENINRVVPPTTACLADLGLRATKEKIQKVAGEHEFRLLRRKRGEKISLRG
jgi:hypothetical protein